MDNNSDYEQPSMQGNFVQDGERLPATQQPVVQQSVMQQPSQPQALPTSGLAIAGMVLGIIALVTAFVPFINFGSPVLAIIGLALSIAGFVGIRKGKKGGKGVAIAGIVLCSIVTVMALLVSAACSAVLSSSSTGSANSSAAAASAVASSSSGTATSESAFVGTWDVVKLTYNGETYTEAQLDAARKKGTDSFLVLEQDGSAKFVLGDDRVDWNWESVDDDTINLVFSNGSKLQMSLKNDKLTGKDLTLKMGEPRSSIPEPKIGQSASSSSATASGVDPELKAFLDSYEAFADEYVEFMRNYKESGDAASMLQDYTEIMQRYNDFASKANSYKSKNMSDADRAYYLEVTTRVSKKLLEAAM